MLQLHEFIRLIRPLNIVMMAAGSMLGVWLVAGTDTLSGQVLEVGLRAAVVVALAGIFGNVFNDWLDFRADRINRPDRPVAAGTVSRKAALVTAIAAAGLSLILAGTLGRFHFFVALSAIGCLSLYNVYLKHVPLLGNACVASLVALSILYGGWTQGTSLPLLLGASFALLTNFAREIVKDIVDIPGDALLRDGVQNGRVGITIRSITAGVVIVGAVLASTWVHFNPAFTGAYLTVMLGADLLLLSAAGWLLDKEFGRSADTLKTAMLVGMVGLGFLV